MELKPCPFCGSSVIVNDDGVGPFGESMVRYAAKCRGCGLSFWHPDCGEVNWNTRPVEGALREALKEIANYDIGNGCCQFGCDCPDIARRALGRG